MKLLIAICDDEPIFCEDAKEKIEKLYQDYEIEMFHSGADLLEAKKNYDIIFLDIEMPNENGMDIAKKLKTQSIRGEIVFLTSHIECMPAAFKVKAFRFLGKPLELEELKETLEEAEKELFENKKLIVDSFGAELLIDVRDIIYIQSEKKTTKLYTMHYVIETDYALKYWIEKLENCDFCKVHKSFLISLRYVDKFEPDEIQLKNTGTCIPLSRRNYVLFKDVYLDYVSKHARIM